MLRKGRGERFEPALVDLFLRLLDEEGEELLALAAAESRMSRLRAWLCGLWLLAFALGLVHGARARRRRRARSSASRRRWRAIPTIPICSSRSRSSLAASERRRRGGRAARARSPTRWPDYRPEASLLLGRLLFEQGRPAEAVPRARARAGARSRIRARRSSILGLALQGAAAAAARPSRTSSSPRETTPELRGEAWLLAGLSRLERGDRAGGDELLARAIDADPAQRVARAARGSCSKAAAARPSRLQLQAYGGVEYDSNATLDSGDDFTGLPSDQSDGAFVWGSGVSIDAVRGERFGVSLGAATTRSSLSRAARLGHAAVRRRALGRLAGRPSGWACASTRASRYARLDGDPYLLSGGLRPSLVFTLGPRAGWLRAFGDAELVRLRREPFSTALERDGFAYGSGLEHVAARSRASRTPPSLVRELGALRLRGEARRAARLRRRLRPRRLRGRRARERVAALARLGRLRRLVPARELREREPDRLRSRTTASAPRPRASGATASGTTRLRIAAPALALHRSRAVGRLHRIGTRTSTSTTTTAGSRAWRFAYTRREGSRRLAEEKSHDASNPPFARNPHRGSPPRTASPRWWRSPRCCSPR